MNGMKGEIYNGWICCVFNGIMDFFCVGGCGS